MTEMETETRLPKTDAEWKQVLTPQEYRVLREKGTEPANLATSQIKAKKAFCCRGCGQQLFAANSKFESGCGWPAFDQALNGAVRETPDKDGKRTEITCSQCLGHLGHVFRGEKLTPEDTRFCVNSISLKSI